MSPSPAPFEWYLGDYNLTTTAHHIRLLNDSDGVPPRRGENMTLAGREGRHYISKLHDQRILTLAMWLSGLSRSDLADRRDALCSALGRSGQQILYRGMANGQQRQIAVQVSANIVFQPVSHLVETLLIEFMAAPYWRALTATTSSLSGLTLPHSFPISNGGTAPDESAIISITPSGGNLTNPRLTIGSCWVQYTGTVNAGQTLSIDCGAFTASKAGANVGGAITSNAVAWLSIAPGLNAATLAGTLSAGAVALSIDHHDTWL